MPAKKPMPKNEEEWKHCLTPNQYNVLRNKGTEIPFTGKYVHNKDRGMYVCAGCKAQLFASDTKFDSGTGWPSFYDVAVKGNVELREDVSHGMRRIEAVCRKCKGHLGHVFDDGPNPTGQRYCINSASLDFKKRRKTKKRNENQKGKK